MNNLLYVAMNGAKASLDRMDRISNNLANVNTDGFRAELMSTKALYVNAKEDMGVTVFAKEAPAGFDSQNGALQTTGNPLDAAIKGDGWFVVQDDAGKEAMTRAGSFTLSATGMLTTASGRPVMGDGGPIEIPAGTADVSISADGIITGKQGGQRAQIGQLKLVKPPLNTIKRSEDGLFRTTEGNLNADETVRLVSGAVEGSNVSAVAEMARMIEAQRRLDMQMKVFTNIEQQGTKASQILNLQ